MMTVLRVFVLLIGLISMQSCISTKKLTYLQENQAQKVDSLAQIHMTQEPYRVQINDMLSVRVKALDQNLVAAFNPVSENSLDVTTEEKVYFDGFTVNRKGEIKIPVLGNLKVLGLTLEEIEHKIEEELLENYFKETSNIFVTVKLPGIPYTTIGEFNQTGSQVIYKERITIMEAIANSGDLQITGDRSNIIVVRQYPSGVKRHSIDLTDLDAINSPYYYVKPNDLIIANPLPQKSYGLGTDAFGTITSILSLGVTLTIIALRL
jgi:polysaccharide export outer membrane protein